MQFDLLGTCPTTYTIETKNKESKIIKKYKDHKKCKRNAVNSYSAFLETPSIPLNSSSSECNQEIKNGEVFSIKCQDETTIVPFPGAFSYISAVTNTNLLFKYKTPEKNNKISLKEFKKCSLSYDFRSLSKTKTVIPRIEEILKTICVKLNSILDNDVSFLTSEISDLISRAPENYPSEILKNITGAKYCENHDNLESWYLDVISSVRSSGTINVILKQISEGKVDGIRLFMYALSLHFTQNPTIENIGNILPLFRNPKTHAYVILGAGTVVGKYCESNPKCLQEKSIQNIMTQVSDKIESFCSLKDKSHSKIEKSSYEILSLMKSAGNMGKISSKLSQTLIQCITDSSVPIHLRVAATHGLRNMQCNDAVSTGVYFN